MTLADATRRLDELLGVLQDQQRRLVALAALVAQMRTVYAVAKRYVTAPYVDTDELELATQLERAVTKAIEMEPKCPPIT